MNVLSDYQQAVASGKIQSNKEQLAVAKKLEQIQSLMKTRPKGLKKLFGINRNIPGLYLWGSVGTGKTFLMDLFFDSLRTDRKLRAHFHNFMHRVHADLRILQGKKNPLEIIAREFSMHYDVLCFDEFYVNDIADASILGGLLTALFNRKVCVILTSNSPPEKLYWRGLQRQRFMATIALIQDRCEVFHLAINQDYRIQKLEKVGAYFYPLIPESLVSLEEIFLSFAGWDYKKNEVLSLYDRPISTVKSAKNIVWFDFYILCQSPRSQDDYLELVKRYSVIVLSNVPKLDECSINQVTYFINLVDILYDAKCILIISAAVPVDSLYQNGPKAFEFQRTRSRLIEMQSKEYFEQPI